MTFKDTAKDYLGRETLAHMHNDGVEEMLKHDPATLRAEMKISPDEFKQILENHNSKNKRPEKKKVVTLFDEKKNNDV